MIADKERSRRRELLEQDRGDVLLVGPRIREDHIEVVRIERQLGKGTILEQYLNRVPLGQSAVGVEAAARLYFAASAASLSLGEAGMLAGLAHAPSTDNPFVSAGRAQARRSRALGRLAALGYASADQITRAETEPRHGSRE